MLATGQVLGVIVTTLVDNYTDALLPSTETITRWESGKEPLLAEHGLALLIEVHTEQEECRTFLLDSGATSTSLLYNMDRMKVEPHPVEFLVVSHGHWDHTGSVVPFLMRRRRELTVLAHPEAFRERWKVLPDGRRIGPRQVDRRQWEAAGACLVVERGSQTLFPGCALTGEIPRKNPYEKAPASARYRPTGDALGTEAGGNLKTQPSPAQSALKDELLPDDIPDDQAVVVALRGKGLVILTGCAHAGIVNTIQYAREITGVDRVWAIMGGFHLAEASDERLAWTIDALRAAAPMFLVATHCTGFKALAALAREMPEAFVLNAVGTRIRFE